MEGREEEAREVRKGKRVEADLRGGGGDGVISFHKSVEKY